MTTPETKNLPDVSVVIPNYNGAQFLEACLRSVFEQSVANIEIIVVDDGSTDNSRELVTGLAASEPRLRLIEKTNGGVASARNRGIREARAAWIAFLDSDDVWHPRKLEWQLSLLDTRSECALCFSAFTFWDASGCEADAQFAATVPPTTSKAAIDEEFSGYIYHLLLRDVYVWTSTVLVSRAALDQVGHFREDLPIGEDYDLWLRLASKFTFCKLAAPVALYRQTGASLTAKCYPENYQALVLENAVATFGRSSPDGREIAQGELNAILHRLWFGFGYRWFWQGGFDKANAAFGRAASYQRRLKTSAYRIASSEWVSPVSRLLLNLLQGRRGSVSGA